MKLWKKILIGFVVFLIITYTSTYLMLQSGQSSFRESEPYKTAVGFAASNEEILGELGGITKMHDGGGSLFSDSASIAFRVDGKKRKLVVSCMLIKSSAGAWSVVKFSYFDYKE